MSIGNLAFTSFNRGVIDRRALARVDLEKLKFCAEIQENWMPRSLGPMTLRPGTEDIGATRNNLPARFIDFVFSIEETALIEVTDMALRFWVDEIPIARSAVGSAFTNGAFDTDLTGWTVADEAGAVSAWTVGGYMGLMGTGYNRAIRRQLVTTSTPNVEHGLRMVVNRGPMMVRVGSTVGGEEYIAERVIDTGTHSWAFTPAGSFYVQFSSYTAYPSLLDSVSIEAAGNVILPAIWGVGDQEALRWEQSGDIEYVACYGKQQQKIARYGRRSWSILTYNPDDGPFLIDNTTKRRLTPSAITGQITVLSSDNLFKPGHVGALFRIRSHGQNTNNTLGGADQYTDPVRITGILEDNGRDFYVTISGTWVGTIVLQRSIGEPGSWVTMDDSFNKTSNTTDHRESPDDDSDDNAIYYYRYGFLPGGYTSGAAVVTITYASGVSDGTVRITGVNSPISAAAIVLKALGGTSATDDWSEGAWSDVRGYPSAVTFHDGRLWWAGKDKFWGSVSDGFESYDDTTVGDSGPISRSIGSGPVDRINWLLSLQRMLAGGEAAVWSVRSNSIDEPITPTNFNVKKAATRGSAAVDALDIDSGGIFVERGSFRVRQLNYSFNDGDYSPADLTLLAPEVCSPGIVSMDIQRQPDTRIHCVLADGTVAILILDVGENLICWVKYKTQGLVEDCIVMPGDDSEDRVYYLVKRGSNRRLERWAEEGECVGGQLCKIADAHVSYSGVPTNIVTGLLHLYGQTVVIWADGIDRGTVVVSGDTVTLPFTFSNLVVGLGYTAPFKSAKLAYAAQMGTALTMRKRIAMLGLIMQDTHYQGLMFGQSFDVMDPLPLVEQSQITPVDTIWGEYDGDMIELPGDWTTDARLCLQATAPRPCTILAAIIALETQEGMKKPRATSSEAQ